MTAVHSAVRAPRRLAAVRLTGLLDTGPEEPFDRLTRLACELLEAPFGFVTVVDERRSFWKSCIGVDSTDPADRQNPVEESFCQYVIATDRPVIIGDSRLDPMTMDNPSIESMGVIAWAGFPVRSPDGQVLGTFCVVDNRPREWSDRQVRTLEVLAHAAGGEVALRLRVDEARAAERAATEAGLRFAALARTLQDSLLPPHLPQVDGLDLAAVYVPGGGGAEVMGDFYDVVPTHGGWSMFVGDVSGKGAVAARTTAIARFTLRSSALRHPRPTLVANELHTALASWFRDDQDPGFVTLAYATLLPVADGFTLQVCTAGHPPAILRRADGELVEVGTAGSILGCLPKITLSLREESLRPGDMLILYSDGVTEARSARDRRRFLGPEGLRAILDAAAPDSAADLADAIRDGVLAYCGTAPRDDIAILVARVRPTDG